MSGRPLLTLVLASVIICSSFAYECSEAEKQEQDGFHRQCMREVQARVHAGTGFHEVCDRLEEQIERCGRHKAKCLEGSELRLFKDMQLESLIKLTDGQDIGKIYNECRIVQEYTSSGRKPWKSTEMCNMAQVGEAMEKRQQCIVEARNELATSKREARARPLHINLICNFVQKSLYDCAAEMKHCFSDEDFQKMLEKSPEALNKLLDVMGSDFDLKTCGSMLEAQPQTSGASPTLLSTGLTLALALLSYLL
eukprot:maker-scaffold109_size355148-snap-gene-2.25 protein:Tk11039 transcript:maker-scaffold109_size355148-snap-gene-2.25-mRNA-1 annotation:"hypothetical protein"